MVEKKTFLLIKYWIKLSLQYGLVHATHVATGPSAAERWNSKVERDLPEIKVQLEFHFSPHTEG